MNTRDRKMNLFNEDEVSNLLPKDGRVNYYGKVLTSKEANQYFDLPHPILSRQIAIFNIPLGFS
jgi:hypothetical protein